MSEFLKTYFPEMPRVQLGSVHQSGQLKELVRFLASKLESLIKRISRAQDFQNEVCDNLLKKMRKMCGLLCKDRQTPNYEQAFIKLKKLIQSEKELRCQSLSLQGEIGILKKLVQHKADSKESNLDLFSGAFAEANQLMSILKRNIKSLKNQQPLIKSIKDLHRKLTEALQISLSHQPPQNQNIVLKEKNNAKETKKTRRTDKSYKEECQQQSFLLEQLLTIHQEELSWRQQRILMLEAHIKELYKALIQLKVPDRDF